jgi:hypothetical protein
MWNKGGNRMVGYSKAAMKHLEENTCSVCGNEEPSQGVPAATADHYPTTKVITDQPKNPRATPA